MNTNIRRCNWCVGNEIYEKYHDEEWGIAKYDDTILFEFLLLEMMQAGLSWLTILKKRNSFRLAFANFDVKMIALFDNAKLEELMNNSSIIRNTLKLKAAIHNAGCFLAIQAKYGSFSNYIWSFTQGQVIKSTWQDIGQIKPTSSLSDRVSKDLKSHGFKFIGSTIIYSYLQAIGVIDDHVTSCFRY